MLKGAIFDHDGLMFDTEKIWQNNWTRVAEEMGIELPDAFRKEICGTSGQLMRDIIQKYYGVEDGEPIRLNVVDGVHAETQIEEKPGLRTILELFKNNGVKIAVASSSYKSFINRNLENAGIESYFDAVVSGTEVEHGKPAPDIFLKAAEELGIDPKDCYVFEDAYNGVRAGSAAGCRTIMIPDTVAPNDEIRAVAYDVCSSLSEAAEKIEKGEY